MRAALNQLFHEALSALLERAFPGGIWIGIQDVPTYEDLAIGSYRFAVSELIPR